MGMGAFKLKVKDQCPRCQAPLVNSKMMGWKVFDNYGVKFADATHDNILEYVSNFPERLQKCVLLIDEQHAVAPGKRAMSSLSLMFALFLEQIRKRNVHLFYTAQNPSRILREILWQTDVGVRCKSSAKGQSIQLSLYDMHGEWTDPDDEEDFVPEWPPQRDPDKVLAIPQANRFWGLYDTDQIVLPTEWYKRRSESQRQQGLTQPVNLDLETPQGKSVSAEVDRAFRNILRDGVDYNVLKGKFTRLGLNEATLVSEIEKRGFLIDQVGVKRTIIPPSVTA